MKHVVPSSIGVDTLTRTLRSYGGHIPNSIRKLLSEAGVPAKCLAALRDVLRRTKYRSCFIAYGSPDEAFARRLDKSLREKGVKTWFFPQDASIGEASLEEERRAKRAADRVLIVCSGAGLSQPGLLREIDETIREDRRKLMPILQDSQWRSPAYRVERDGRDLKAALAENVWALFKDKPYERALREVLRALKRPARRRRP